MTHDPVEVERLCHRVAVIEAGRVTQHGTLASLRAQPATTFVERLSAFLARRGPTSTSGTR